MASVYRPQAGSSTGTRPEAGGSGTAGLRRPPLLTVPTLGPMTGRYAYWLKHVILLSRNTGDTRRLTSSPRPQNASRCLVSHGIRDCAIGGDRERRRVRRHRSPWIRDSGRRGPRRGRCRSFRRLASGQFFSKPMVRVRVRVMRFPLDVAEGCVQSPRFH